MVMLGNSHAQATLASGPKGRSISLTSALKDLKTRPSDLLDRFQASKSNDPTSNNLADALKGRKFHDLADVPFTQLDLERILGNNDLVGIAYLSRGSLAAKSVGRIVINSAQGNPLGFATGFMISPRLLLTNHHVFGSAEDAKSSLVEFDFEYDEQGISRPVTTFRFEPSKAFLTPDPVRNPDLDFAICAVAELDVHGQVPLSTFGYLRLDSQPGKVAKHEYITIIQHPNGEHKQIAVRENEVIEKSSTRPVLLYHSDTAPGSSGSPCFNDQWQVVALHAAGVTAEDRPDLKVDPETRGRYVANLGVRISSIIDYVSASQPANSLLTELLLDVHLGGASIVTASAVRRQPVPSAADERAKPVKVPGGPGYDPLFLGKKHAVPLPTLTKAALKFGKPAINKETGLPELPYMHYSVVQNATRRLAFFSAVNINGLEEVSKARPDDFRIDPRVEDSEQAGNWLYGDEKPNFFDRGHLTRRKDPCWGDDSSVDQANSESNCFPNISPQYYLFNQGKQLWAGLEDHILTAINGEDVLGSVFTGPVFTASDTIHRGVPIPKEFWKVAVAVDTSGVLHSSAYVVSQEEFVTPEALEQVGGEEPTEKFTDQSFGAFLTFQVTLAEIEEKTGLQFSNNVREADSFSTTNGSTEATKGQNGSSGSRFKRQKLSTPEDIQF